MKKISLLLLALLACLSLAARDFDAVCPSGQTLYYDMVQGGAMVVGWDYSNQDNGPIHLVIPSVVNNGGTNLHVIAIGDNAFSIGRRMVSVTIPSSVKSIGASAFNRCFGLGSISIPSTVESIGTDAFAFIPNVEYAGPAVDAPWGALIVVPRSFISFGNEAFSGCNGVSRIVCMKDTIPVMATGVFDSIDPGIEVVVPCSMVDEYSQESHWQKFENIHGQQYFMVVTSNNPLWGKAVVTRQPTCDDNAAVIEAVPEEGCRFVKWSDSRSENPHQISYSGTGYAYRKAIFEKTVGIQEPKPVSDIKVYTSHGNIVIEGARGEQLSLFDLMGRQLLTTKITTDNFVLLTAKSQQPKAIYLVKVGNRKADKVMVFN